MVSVVDALRSLDSRYHAAISDGDLAAMEDVLADDYVHIHADGRAEDRRAYLAEKRRTPKPSPRLLSNVEVGVHGDVAITRGDLDVVHRDKGTVYLRYVCVHRAIDGRWQTISHRSFPAPDRKPR